MNRNPIFLEYYSHEGCDCYKIFNPFTRYKSYKIVLCRLDKGIEKAKELAKEVIANELQKALSFNIESQVIED